MSFLNNNVSLLKKNIHLFKTKSHWPQILNGSIFWFKVNTFQVKNKECWIMFLQKYNFSQKI